MGNAHEENPNALDKINDLSGVTFNSLSGADEAIDLLNNRIGRFLGLCVTPNSKRAIAIYVLNYFRDSGLWVASEQSDGTFKIVQQALTREQYDGFTEEQRRQYE
nr:hypothetical protein [Paenibacillus koleovorans]